MSDLTKAIPVQKWLVRLERVVDEDAAIAGWHALVRAQGWSPVGDPETGNDGQPFVMGRLVQYPGITVAHDVRDAIVVPR